MDLYQKKKVDSLVITKPQCLAFFPLAKRLFLREKIIRSEPKKMQLSPNVGFFKKNHNLFPITTKLGQND